MSKNADGPTDGPTMDRQNVGPSSWLSTHTQTRTITRTRITTRSRTRTRTRTKTRTKTKTKHTDRQTHLQIDAQRPHQQKTMPWARCGFAGVPPSGSQADRPAFVCFVLFCFVCVHYPLLVIYNPMLRTKASRSSSRLSGAACSSSCTSFRRRARSRSSFLSFLVWALYSDPSLSFKACRCFCFLSVALARLVFNALADFLSARFWRILHVATLQATWPRHCFY